MIRSGGLLGDSCWRFVLSKKFEGGKISRKSRNSRNMSGGGVGAQGQLTRGQMGSVLEPNTNAQRMSLLSLLLRSAWDALGRTFIPKLLLRWLWFFRRTAALFRQICTFPQLFRFCSDLGNSGIRQIVRNSMLTPPDAGRRTYF